MPVAPNLLERRFHVPAPNTAWVSDITYLWTRHGWLYLAVIVDLYSRKVVGWSLRERMTADLVCEALDAAVRARPRTTEKWYADFRFQHAEGTVERVRKRSPVQSKAGADEFEHQLRTELLIPVHTVTKEVPKFSAYATEFMGTYVVANTKPSERSMKACILKHHLLPVFGDMPLDAIKMLPIEVLKASLLAKGLSRKRVNNILACRGKIPLTVRLKAALKAHRHLKSDLVFCHPDGKPLTQSAIEAALRSVCSTLGSRWAVPKALQFEVARSNGNISGEGGLRTLGRISPTSA